MVTYIITLKSIHDVLYKIQNNKGAIKNILISVKSKESGKHTKSISFGNLEVLAAEIAKCNVDGCFNLNLFQLKKFNIDINKKGSNKSTKNIVKYDSRVSKFKSSSDNIEKANMILLDYYMTGFNKIKATWNGVDIDEYILAQNEYIALGYIQLYF